MLIQITNHCTLGCSHCMQCASENKHHMSPEVFAKALEFGAWSDNYIYNISGGEPTEHPMFEQFIEQLAAHIAAHPHPKMPNLPVFTIESNGEWVRSAQKVQAVKRILKQPRLVGLQISSFKGLYRNYDFIQKYKRKIEALSSKVCIVDEGIRSMQDLGRASTTNHPIVLKQIADNPHYMSCLNGCLSGKQVGTLNEAVHSFMLKGFSCKPLVDWQGNVHWSESICCPSYGNVLTDPFETIWENMRCAIPCGKCSGYQRFLKSDNPQIVMARALLGIKI